MFGKKRLNKFQQEISVNAQRIASAEICAKDFGDKVVKAMGLSSLEWDDIKGVRVFETENYYLEPRTCFWKYAGGWTDTIVAIPKSVGSHDVGYSNVEVREPDPSKWFYKAGGTTTVIYPYPEEAEIVLQEIKEEVNR